MKIVCWYEGELVPKQSTFCSTKRVENQREGTVFRAKTNVILATLPKAEHFGKSYSGQRVAPVDADCAQVGFCCDGATWIWKLVSHPIIRRRFRLSIGISCRRPLETYCRRSLRYFRRNVGRGSNNHRKSIAEKLRSVMLQIAKAYPKNQPSKTRRDLFSSNEMKSSFHFLSP